MQINRAASGKPPLSKCKVDTKFNSQKLTANRAEETHRPQVPWWHLSWPKKKRGKTRELAISQPRKRNETMQNACRAWAALVAGLRGKERSNYCSKFDLPCWFGRRKMRKNIVGIVFPSITLSLLLSPSRWPRFMCGWSNKIIASDFLCKSLFAPWLSHGQNKPSICIYAGLNYFYDLLGPTWGFNSPTFLSQHGDVDFCCLMVLNSRRAERTEKLNNWANAWHCACTAQREVYTMGVHNGYISNGYLSLYLCVPRKTNALKPLERERKMSIYRVAILAKR